MIWKMKRHGSTARMFFYVFFLLSWHLCGDELGISLDGEWDFTFKDGLVADIPTLPEDSSYDTKIKVPDYMNYFQTQKFINAKWWKWGDDYFHRRLYGIGFYRKFIDIPKGWDKKSITLHVGRAYNVINVWVNGKHIVSSPYISSIPCEADLSEALKAGERNEIIISVDNQKKMGGNEKKDFGKYGGIVEPVYLKVSKSHGRIDDLYIRPGADLREILWEVSLKKIPVNGQVAKKSQIDWVITEWGSSSVIGKGITDAEEFNDNSKVRWSSTHPNIKPWHINSPYLYEAKLVWRQDGAVIDTLTQRFGLRRWSTEERILKLNDKPIFIRELWVHGDVPHYRYPPDKAYWLRYFQLMKEYGYNTMLLTQIIASQEALEAADEIGVAISTGYLLGSMEYYFQKPGTKLFDVWSLAAKWTRNYPSMWYYLLGAEAPYYEGYIDDVSKVDEIVKSINPESMLMPNQCMYGIQSNFLEEDEPYLTTEPFPYHAERLERITKCSDLFGVSMPKHAGHSYSLFKDTWDDIDKQMTVYKRPLISHEIMFGIAGNNRALPRYYLEDFKFTSLRYGRQSLEYFCEYSMSKLPGTEKEFLSRFDSKKKVYYDNMSQLYSAMCKYNIEKVRKSNNIAGYQDLQATGGLSFCLDPLPGSGVDKWERFNRDNVLLLDFDNGYCLKRCYWEKEPFEAKVMLSLFGTQSVPYGVLTWRIKDGDKVLSRGFSQPASIQLGKVTTIADMKFNWPEVSVNTKLNLEIRFSGFGCDTHNDWDFWIFKNESPKELEAACDPGSYQFLKDRYPGISQLRESSVKLWIVDSLTKPIIEHLAEGGDVLLIGSNPFPVYTMWPKFQQGYRNWHEHGTIVHKHPVFKNIPNDGWGDWQFFPLVTGTYPVVFTNNRGVPPKCPKTYLMKDVPFNPIFEAISYNQKSEEAYIFELRAGKGRLFVATCIKNLKDPTPTVLMDSILEYVTGNEFAPAQGVGINTLKALENFSPTSITNNEITFKPKDFSGGTMFPQHSSFGNAPRDGVCVRPGEKINLDFVLDETQRISTDGSDLILSIEGQDCEKQEITDIEISLNSKPLYKGSVKCIKNGWSTWNIPFSKKSLLAGVNNLELKNMGKALPGKEDWFMIADLKIKAEKTKSEQEGIEKQAASKEKAENMVQWSNEPVKIKLEGKRLYKINDGDWRQGATGQDITVDTIGRNKIYMRIKGKTTVQEVCIDNVIPKLTLISNPPVLQVTGEYFATTKTDFAVRAEDNQSGIKRLEISIDAEDFKPYDGGNINFTSGRHRIRARCEDLAGNKTNIFTGGLSGGGNTDYLPIQVE